MNKLFFILSLLFLFYSGILFAPAQVSYTPTEEELNRPFGEHDKDVFLAPSKIYYPETWFHYIGGNVSLEGITTDLEAIAKAGISGIQLFHGQFGGSWPGVEPQITSLSPNWDKAVRHTAEECKRLGLRFTMQNCPGWATSGGPWIEPSNAMRNLVWSRTDVEGGETIKRVLPMPQPSSEEWRDYKDITVLAFPTPLDNTDKPLIPQNVESNYLSEWIDFLAGVAKEPINLTPTTEENPYWIEVTFPEAVFLRSVEFPSINSMNHGQCFEPGIKVKIEAILSNGTVQNILSADMPQANWEDRYPITFACSEIHDVNKYRISIINKYNISLSSLRLFSDARKNSWESEAGWTLRSIERAGASPKQNPDAFVSLDQTLDITTMMDQAGNLNWLAPEGKWTILRVGHVNSGMKNSPAPPEGTGWECDKLSVSGANAQFAGYIGRLIGQGGVLKNGLLNGMLLDSWECNTQTWTPNMEKEFMRKTSYPLRKWMPALFGYVVKDHETTARFLYDWRSTLNDLFVHNFYGRMSELARENNLSITYETAAGDVYPSDILEYFKFADVPMCEFWQPITDGFVGSSNFKPIKPTVSAARMYGKPRIAAEAFTSFDLTWDEHLDMLKEVANIKTIDGISHMVFHTYTHNPQTPFLPPGTSFGSDIGTPFLRGQTWWKYMPEFTTYLSRCSYMLERGKPVSDVLWYLGDEINHKPDQHASFPEGFKNDYCNPDVLLNRLIVKDGQIMTPEGISYRVLWLPETFRMLPETLEKIHELINAGATVVGNAPLGLVSLVEEKTAQKRFDTVVENIWGNDMNRPNIREIGKGRILSNMTLETALSKLNMEPDVIGGNALWLHRQVKGADWYFICPPKGEEFSGTLNFRNKGRVELWDPVTGTTRAINSQQNGDRTSVTLNLSKAESCFVVFRHLDGESHQPIKVYEHELVQSTSVSSPWTLTFPTGWGAPNLLEIENLQAWKDLNISEEGKAFSGTVIYNTTFDVNEIKPDMTISIDLGRVEMIASVSVNGKHVRSLWAPPYSLDITDAVRKGENTLTIEVTSSWFNRLVYDASQAEKDRKTWTIKGPSKDNTLKEYGLLGPVKINFENKVAILIESL